MPAREQKQTKSQSQRLLHRVILVTVAAVVFSVWVVATFYVFQKYSASLSFSSTRALVFSPKYLSLNEDEEFRFAFENPSPNPVDVTFGLENNSARLGFLGLQESNIVYSGTLQSRQQINRQAKVFFPFDLAQFDQSPKLSLWASIANAAVEKKDLDVYLAPFPLARSISNYFGTVLLGLVGLLLRDLWEQVKKSNGKKR